MKTVTAREIGEIFSLWQMKKLKKLAAPKRCGAKVRFNGDGVHRFEITGVDDAAGAAMLASLSSVLLTKKPVFTGVKKVFKEAIDGRF